MAEQSRRIASSDVIPMFPTLVWKMQLEPEVSEAINRQVLGKLGELRRDAPELKPGEAWQSDHALHRDSELAELISIASDAAERTLGFLKIGHDGIEVTGCWLNFGTRGSSHRAHAHPNNFLSGVYYVETHEGANTIDFHDPRPQTAIIRPGVRELTAENTDQVTVRVSDGTLLVFPAWLEHSVPPSTSEQRRVSVSFNIMFSAYTETMSAPLW